MDGTSYPISPSGFLLENFNGHTCAVMISYISDSQNMLILGDTFFRNYYTELWYSALTIKIAATSTPNIIASLKPPINPPTPPSPTPTPDSSSDVGLIVGLVIGAVLLIVLMIVLVLWLKPKLDKTSASIVPAASLNNTSIYSMDKYDATDETL